MSALTTRRLFNVNDILIMAANASLVVDSLPKLSYPIIILDKPDFLESTSIKLALGVAGLCVLLPAICYLVTLRSFVRQRFNQDSDRVPPIVPYALPYLGHAVGFVLSPAKFLSAISKYVGPQPVWGLKVLENTLFFLHGPENVAPIWKYKTTITDPGVQTFCLIGLFGMSHKAVNMYTEDNSGILLNPEPDSDIAPHNRIDYHTHAGFHKLLNGDRLATYYQRWSLSFMRRLQLLNIEDDWKKVPDIMDFWMPPLTGALNEALAGPILEKVNPNFTRDFLDYFPYVHDLMKGLPRLFCQRGYALRDSLIRDVKEWHKIARIGFKDADIDEHGDADPWWGSEAIRERQQMLSKVDNWDDNSIASSDFGLLWGAGINVHTAAVWTLVETFRDKSLLSRVRSELRAANFNGITTNQDIDKILALPLLQSIYAEVLRLRVEVQSVFTSDREDIRINEWRFPRKSLLLVPTGVAHRDESFWNTKMGEHPVNQFWADRFLVYANDPQSGPRKKTTAEIEKVGQQQQKRAGAAVDEPKFISSGLANTFMPFGVGERTCPGRFLARREIVAFCAQIVHRFDMDILSTEKDFEISEAFYGLGTQRPRNKIPFTIRRRVMA